MNVQREQEPIRTAKGLFEGQGLPRPGQKAQVSPEGIIRSTDGKYRWVYEVNQWKDRGALMSLLVKYALVGLGIGLLFRLMGMGSLLLLPVLTVGGAVLAMATYAADILAHGGTYCLLFTADEHMIRSQQVQGRSDREKVMRVVSEWVGGQSYPELTFKPPVEIALSRVTRIRPNAKREFICIDGAFAGGRIYADPRQFDFVLTYLKQQCPQGSIKD